MDADTAVVDDAAHHRFTYAEGGEQAELVYRVDGNRLVLVHTGVPEAYRGQGVGGKLVQAAVERASATGEAIVPSCRFARTWLEDHPAAIEGITIDWEA